jgi:hypothetical protein
MITNVALTIITAQYFAGCQAHRKQHLNPENSQVLSAL